MSVIKLDKVNWPEGTANWNWVDAAKELSVQNNASNIVVLYDRKQVEFTPIYNPEQSNSRLEDVAEFNAGLISAKTLEDLATLFAQHLDKSLPGLDAKETEITNYINFIFAHVVNSTLHIDGFSEDGVDLGNYLNDHKVIDPSILVSHIKDVSYITGIELKDNKKGKPLFATTFKTLETGLFINKIFGPLTKSVISRYLESANHVISRVEDPELYNEIVNTLREVNPNILLSKLYINFKDFPKREFTVVVKDDHIRLF